MNKVVCNLCGTSYPENATQCPICGYVRSAEASPENSGNSTYTYVKGGRFSKANVKKRNQAAGTLTQSAVAVEKKGKRSEQKSAAGLTIVIIVLLLAIVAVLGYIALRFFLPNDFLFEGLDNLKMPSSQGEDAPVVEDPLEDETETAAPDLSCKEVTLSQTQIVFEAIGSECTLSVTTDPADTTDTIQYSSSDPSVISVSDDGIVKAENEGSAVITVTCGSVSVQCTVTCTVPTTEDAPAEISLNRKEITFETEGQSWVLYSGEIPAADIVWTSDDNKVATIENGKVVAVANGDTVVYGVYNDQTVSCIIHCKFDGENAGQTGGISEAGGESNRTYKLYNPFGNADDVTLKVGEKFTLKLVDENKEQVTDAQWQIEDEKVCSYEDNIVEALKVGTTKIIVTYEGVTYTCVVRVI